ncbi:HAMP domain-containing sensor histidine kinase [Stenotrophomonas sp. WHRI 8082]|uniref:sensor histidine kinase n=1 Tax=Stenotrophomonas sp. WHRI 8082 TaxID=3162571 RepID=UPI0032F05939
MTSQYASRYLSPAETTKRPWAALSSACSGTLVVQLHLLLLLHAGVQLLDGGSMLSMSPLPPHWMSILLMALLATTNAVLCATWVAAGRVRSGVGTLVVVSLVSSPPTAHWMGFATAVLHPVTLLLLPLLAGLAAGRAALWSVWCALLCLLALNRETTPLWWAAGYTLLTLGIDGALRMRTVEQARRRHDAARLQQEVARCTDLRARLHRAEKLAVMGNLNCGIAHDFNHVLALLQGFRDQAQRRSRQLPPDEELDNALQGMTHAVQLGEHLSGALLRVSRLDDTRPERFDAGCALLQLRPLLEPLFINRSQLRPPEISTKASLYMDRSEFALMILNLVINARDALRPASADHVRIELDRHGDQVEISVRDSGRGMHALQRQRLFDPLYTGRTTARGHGLGLMLVQERVTAYGGTISVHSVLGEGTDVRLRLPAA